jgi:transposase-like protein
VSAVARQYGMNTNMVFTWRKQYGAASVDGCLNPRKSGAGVLT